MSVCEISLAKSGTMLLKYSLKVSAIRGGDLIVRSPTSISEIWDLLHVQEIRSLISFHV